MFCSFDILTFNLSINEVEIVSCTKIKDRDAVWPYVLNHAKVIKFLKTLNYKSSFAPTPFSNKLEN